MATHFEIDNSFISEQNQKTDDWVEEDYEHLSKKLRRQNVDIEDLVTRAEAFRVAIPSWGVGTGGTRFARFPGQGEPRDIYEKLKTAGPFSNWFARPRQYRCMSRGTNQTMSATCVSSPGSAACISMR